MSIKPQSKNDKVLHHTVRLVDWKENSTVSAVMELNTDYGDGAILCRATNLI